MIDVRELFGTWPDPDDQFEALIDEHRHVGTRDKVKKESVMTAENLRLMNRYDLERGYALLLVEVIAHREAWKVLIEKVETLDRLPRSIFKDQIHEFDLEGSSDRLAAARRAVDSANIL